MTRYSVRGPMMAGLAVLALGCGGFVAWAVATEIDGAVVTQGRVEVEARRQTLQHPDGGMVAEIFVRDGQTVKAGAPLIRLDDSELLAQRALLHANLTETLARIDRLQAEVSDAQTITFDEELLADATENAQTQRLLASETALFDSRRDTQARTLEQLTERKKQTQSLIGGYQRQVQAGNRQLQLIRQELTDQASLLDRGLTQASRVSALYRQEAELQGNIGQLEASIAEARSSIAGYEIEGLRTQASRREESQDALRSEQPNELQIREQLGVTETRLGRLVLRAPMSGRVLGLKIHTIGGVIAAGQEVVSIVPQDVPLIFMVRIDPLQIDRIHAGQSAMVRFPNFNSRTTPSFSATLRTVSPDTITDPNTQSTYYTAELELTPEANEALGDLPLQPGMPLEAFIRTGARSPASVLVKPLSDYMAYALRED
ncbi:HlyD family type I secretion periplasmic adaptor subunit [Thioclava sp. FTW29]|uniref:Membrane fusion protein (MFP) family protein n=1 Tax=Thioclava litoralis TaxID=3076557 RepID=A0ABZ1E341_9RHOB|nr:HlyD family type I secretion periplasmic adaptor subunit [Thioclava sp. FTW29]